MAVDHALLASVQAGGRPVLRLYRWEPACLSFGRNQHAAGIYDPSRLAAAGLDVVRRPTGGLAVLHDRELTYCVLAPMALLGGPRAAYLLINEALVDALRRLGVPAEVAGSGGGGDPRRDTTHPCFTAPAAGEVIAAGRKLIGSAQRCEGRTILQHGSMLLDGSQDRVRTLVRGGLPTAEATSGSTTLAELLGRAVPPSELAVAVAEGFRSRCGICLAPDNLAREEETRMRELEGVYGSAEWTWRR